MSGVTILYFLLLSIPFVEPLEPNEDKRNRSDAEFIDKFFKTGQAEGLSFDKMEKWWTGFKEKRHKLEKKIPICMGKDDGKYPPVVDKMAAIFDDIENIGVPDGGIELKEGAMYTVKLIYKDPYDKRQLSHPIHQWVTYHLEFSKPVKAVYVQAMIGPLGVPGGEFTKGLRDCAGMSDTELRRQTQTLIPCSYSPKTAYMYPNVFFASAKNEPFSQTAFGFRWIQGQCLEICYFQFIIIATDDFSKYSYHKVLVRLTKLDSPSGVYYPYHAKTTYDWSDCEEVTETGDSIKLILDKHATIIINQDYDDCVSKGIGRTEYYKDVTRLQCAPGILKCTKPWNTAAEWESMCNQAWANFLDAQISINESNIPTTLKPINPTTTLGPLQQTQQELARDGIRQEKKEAVSHGDVCIMIFLIVSPLSDFIMRYYKDFPQIKCLGLGVWIIIHVTSAVINIFCFWLSLGHVAGTGSNKMGNVSGEHFICGIITALLQHHQYYTGLLLGNPRPTERKRFSYLLVHALSGYAVHLCGLICVTRSKSNVGHQRILISLFLFGIVIVCHLIAIYIEKRQERVLQIHRGHCPVLQPIISDKRKCPPLIVFKLLNLAFLIVSQTCAYAYMKIYYSVDSVELAISQDDEKGYQ